MSKSNGRKDIATRVKAALAPKLPRITLVALTVVYDAKAGQAGVTFASPQTGLLDVADLYKAVEAARRHVMQMEQQMLLEQAGGLRQAQPAEPVTAGQLAEGVAVPEAEGSRQ